MFKLVPPGLDTLVLQHPPLLPESPVLQQYTFPTVSVSLQKPIIDEPSVMLPPHQCISSFLGKGNLL